MDMMRISQLATRSGIPASTLRFYDSAGLLPAARTAAGYRLYGEEAVERLGLISTAKHLGLPLEEIGDLLAVWETGTCAQVKADLQSRIPPAWPRRNSGPPRSRPSPPRCAAP